MTIGTRRLVHACKSRGIVFVAHDLHMHGLSLKQNGVEYPEVMRGNHQGANVIARHYVELSKALVAQYSLPLIVSSHSQSAVAHIMATAALVQVCKDAGVPLACQLYLAPTPSGLSPAWCPDCFFEQVCAKCCCACTCCTHGAIGIELRVGHCGYSSAPAMPWAQCCAYSIGCGAAPTLLQLGKDWHAPA